MDPLLDLLSPSLSPTLLASSNHAHTSQYLARLSSLPFDSILTNEPAALKAANHSINLSLQSLASRSHRHFIISSNHLSTLPSSLTKLNHSITGLQEALPLLDDAIGDFGREYHKSSPLLQERQQKQTLARTLPRLLDILELPALLQSAIASSNPGLALDVHSHVRRLGHLYPDTPVISSITADCDDLLQTLNTHLLTTLRGSLKLPVAIKTIGYLKRTSPDVSGGEEVWGAIFLVARLAFLESLFQALEPLRELAEAEWTEWTEWEKMQSQNGGGDKKRGSVGGQTERYLKRWIEVFREQSFAIVGMYRAVFPASSGPMTTSSVFAVPQTPLTGTTATHPVTRSEGPPSPLATFVPHLVSYLTTTLQKYLPVVSDKSGRESLLTQVLYAAGSLGRLGGDFGMVLSMGLLGDEEDDDEGGEWVEMMNKHKILAGRLEDLASGRSPSAGGRLGSFGGSPRLGSSSLDDITSARRGSASPSLGP